jgi:hypothetical protein
VNVRDVAQANLRKHYQQGLEDGARMVLERLLGHPEGPEVVTVETERWARDCLSRSDTPEDRALTRTQGTS